MAIISATKMMALSAFFMLLFYFEGLVKIQFTHYRKRIITGSWQFPVQHKGDPSYNCLVQHTVTMI